MKILSEEDIVGMEINTDKKAVRQKLKNTIKTLLVLSGVYLFLTMIILVGCIWQVDAGTYRIIGTIMIFMIPVFLFELFRGLFFYKVYHKKDKPEIRKRAVEDKKS